MEAVERKYNFVYLTTNNLNGKYYAGVHSSNTPPEQDTYLGSGVALQRSITKYGEENFTRTILHDCNSRKQALELEAAIVDEKWVRDQGNYNLCLGGNGGSMLEHSEETKTLQSVRQRARYGKTLIKTYEKVTNKLKGLADLYDLTLEKCPCCSTLVFIGDTSELYSVIPWWNEADQHFDNCMHGTSRAIRPRDHGHFGEEHAEADAFMGDTDMKPEYYHGDWERSPAEAYERAKYYVWLEETYYPIKPKQTRKPRSKATNKVVSEKQKKTMKKKFREMEPLTCPHCGKEGKGNIMYHWHFDNCKDKGAK